MMGLFAKILEKLGIKEAAPAKPEVPQPAPIPPAVKPSSPVVKVEKPVGGKYDVNVTPPASPKPAPSTKPIYIPRTSIAIPVVDVVTKLDKLAKENPEKLNWKTSIVDLLKLLGLSSSLADRKELAKELGCPPEKIGGDYAEMNVWLHKTVLQKIADNGGNIPKELLG